MSPVHEQVAEIVVGPEGVTDVAFTCTRTPVPRGTAAWQSTSLAISEATTRAAERRIVAVERLLQAVWLV